MCLKPCPQQVKIPLPKITKFININILKIITHVLRDQSSTLNP
jgi:hypothetical protein